MGEGEGTGTVSATQTLSQGCHCHSGYFTNALRKAGRVRPAERTGGCRQREREREQEVTAQKLLGGERRESRSWKVRSLYECYLPTPRLQSESRDEKDQGVTGRRDV